MENLTTLLSTFISNLEQLPADPPWSSGVVSSLPLLLKWSSDPLLVLCICCYVITRLGWYPLIWYTAPLFLFIYLIPVIVLHSPLVIYFTLWCLRWDTHYTYAQYYHLLMYLAYISDNYVSYLLHLSTCLLVAVYKYKVLSLSLTTIT